MEKVVSTQLATYNLILEDVENGSEPDFRDLLRRTRKRNETPIAESDSLPCYVRIKALNSKIIYKL